MSDIVDHAREIIQRETAERDARVREEEDRRVEQERRAAQEREERNKHYEQEYLSRKAVIDRFPIHDWLEAIRRDIWPPDTTLKELPFNPYWPMQVAGHTLCYSYYSVETQEVAKKGWFELHANPRDDSDYENVHEIRSHEVCLAVGVAVDSSLLDEPLVRLALWQGRPVRDHLATIWQRDRDSERKLNYLDEQDYMWRHYSPRTYRYRTRVSWCLFDASILASSTAAWDEIKNALVGACTEVLRLRFPQRVPRDEIRRVGLEIPGQPPEGQ